MKIYQVGGSVRDKILNKQPNDLDYVVVGATPQEMRNLDFIEVGKNFPVFIHPQTHNEYALARKEIKVGNKHTDFKFIFTPNITLEEDLLRRDFTCNALALDTETDKIIDIVNGINDINNKILRHINQHFSEDPLRILRMCRFAAQLDFEIAPETIELSTNMVKENMLSNLSNERIWKEFEKAMQSNHFDKFVKTAIQCGALQVIFPRLNEFNNPHITNQKLSILQKANNYSPFTKFTLLINQSYLSKQKNIDNIHDICNILKLPKAYKNFAIMYHNYYDTFNQIIPINENVVFDNLEEITKFKNWQTLEELKNAYLCANFQNKNAINEYYKNSLRILHLVQKYKVGKLVNLSTTRGKEIREQYKIAIIKKYNQL